MVRGFLVLFATLVIAYVGALVLGRARWDSRTNQLIDRLDAARRPIGQARYDTAEIKGLPAPVQRYFRFALRDGQPMIAAANIRHRGQFNLDLDTARWIEFTSRQHVVARRPGFVWTARMAMGAGLGIFVHDAYVSGEGILNPSILGLFDIQDMRGRGDIAHGELMRFLAEAAWYPTALLPSQGVTWTAIDDQRALVTLVDDAVAVKLTFTFLPSGAIASARAEARGLTKGAEILQLPWEGRWSDYAERDGMQVPLRGEVAWLTPNGRQPYWRATVTDIAYEYAKITP